MIIKIKFIISIKINKQFLEATPHKVAAVRLPTTHHEQLSKLDEPDMRDTAGEVGTSS